MTSMVSAISARGTVTTASWMSCSSRRSAPSAVAGVNGADAAGMAGAPGLQEIERLGAAHLADRNAIGTQPQRRAHEIGQRGDAVLGAQRHEVRRRCIAVRAYPRSARRGRSVLATSARSALVSVVLPVEVPPATRMLRRVSDGCAQRLGLSSPT